MKCQAQRKGLSSTQWNTILHILHNAEYTADEKNWVRAGFQPVVAVWWWTTFSLFVSTEHNFPKDHVKGRDSERQSSELSMKNNYIILY